jgi:DNA repair exonuclease SbcCD nuclease subunit
MNNQSTPAVVFSDLHAHSYKAHNDDEDKRLANCLKVLNVVFNYANKNGICYIIFCGDLYDRQQTLPTKVVNGVLKRFKELFDRYPDIWFLAISGNHDHATRNTIERPAVTALQHLADVFPKFVLLDNEHATLYRETNVPSVRLHGVPYYEIPQHVEQAVQCRVTFEDGLKEILLCHQTPKGLLPDIVQYDVDPANEVFDRFDFIMSGHIHTGGRLSDKWLSLCSPLHRDKGDEGQERGFYVIDLENPTTSVRFISTNSKFPLYKTATTIEELEAEQANGHYVTLKSVAATLRNDTADETERFTTDLSPSQLLENFWEKQGGEDRELLAVGLNLLTIAETNAEN